MSEWIKVSERLPENGERVLAFDENGAYYACNIQKRGKYDYCHFLDHNNVVLLYITHWMPLPPPPPEAE